MIVFIYKWRKKGVFLSERTRDEEQLIADHEPSRDAAPAGAGVEHADYDSHISAGHSQRLQDTDGTGSERQQEDHRSTVQLRIGFRPAQNASLLFECSFSMFVPSLSWENDSFEYDSLKRRRFSHQETPSLAFWYSAKPSRSIVQIAMQQAS